MNTSFLNSNTKFIISFLFFSFIIFSLGSCGKRDDSSSFNPPEWIKGEWSTNNGIKYKFSRHDFILTVGNSRHNYDFVNGNKFIINVIKRTSTEYIFELTDREMTDTFSPPGIRNNQNTFWKKTSVRKLYFEFKRNSDNMMTEKNKIFFRTGL